MTDENTKLMFEDIPQGRGGIESYNPKGWGLVLCKLGIHKYRQIWYRRICIRCGKREKHEK
jgi:hypothetical protein